MDALVDPTATGANTGTTPARRLQAGPLVVASHNPGKVREIADLLAPFQAFEVISAADLSLPEPEETGTTFAANAALKALAAARASGHAALSDDSGLEVVALEGAPGVLSARWAGPDKDFDRAMRRIKAELGDGRDRRANFTCALSLAWPDGHVETVEGRVFGDIVWPPRGDNGFGYDPIFQPDGYNLTFGEMAPEAKHAISHRAEAFRLLVDTCLPSNR